MYPNKYWGMYLENSTINREVKKVHKLPNGTIYVFDDFLVSEFKEDAIIDFDCFVQLYHYLNSYSENKKSFGYISNRVHKYTVKVTDFMRTKSLTQKIYPTAVVTYDDEGKNTFMFEKKVYNCQAFLCDSLDKAINHLTGRLVSIS
ncbi:hypothetical protein GCM10011344_02260 [Dokdonia pacifica]|uniref:Uncharacterized protein n=2 Tax=Dokdonia pacifica TaxID=1627892 RepID=A0A238ZAI7_9FLAO|nr:hypothetical protein GCM10011344_02260 [Dokdonia pacifica]SNR80555.1 hypothetical protein SAMN06265376_10386 [Dokdonia pacifica]